MTVNIHARDNKTNQEWTSTYWPRVDEFSLLAVNGTDIFIFFLCFGPFYTFLFIYLISIPNATRLAFNPNLTITIELVGYDNVYVIQYLSLSLPITNTAHFSLFT